MFLPRSLRWRSAFCPSRWWILFRFKLSSSGMAIKASAPPLRLLQRSLPRLCTPLAGFPVKSATYNPYLLFVVAVFPVFGNSRLQLEEEEEKEDDDDDDQNERSRS
jgi:hypothetical protein